MYFKNFFIQIKDDEAFEDQEAYAVIAVKEEGDDTLLLLADDLGCLVWRNSNECEFAGFRRKGAARLLSRQKKKNTTDRFSS